MGNLRPQNFKKPLDIFAEHGIIHHASERCGCSSSGRAPPCQGGGSEFEPRHPLHFNHICRKANVVFSVETRLAFPLHRRMTEKCRDIPPQAHTAERACREIEICTAPSCPLYRGLSAKLTGGCIDEQFQRMNDTIANLQQPPGRPAGVQPPVEGAREGAQHHFKSSVQRIPPLSIVNYQLSIQSQIPIFRSVSLMQEQPPRFEPRRL